MKKSILYLIVGTVVAISILYFPNLYGIVQLREDNRPANALSRLWMGTRDLRIVKPLTTQVTVLRVEGNGHQIGLHIQPGNTNFMNSSDVHDYRVERVGDTLILHASNGFDAHISLAVPPKEVIFNKVIGSLNYRFDQTSLKLVANQHTRLTVRGGQGRERRPHLDSIALTVNERSVVNLSELEVTDLSAIIQNGEVNYTTSLKADSIHADLRGKSTIKSDKREDNQQVKHLVVSGNAGFFKNEFAGRGVSIKRN